MSDPTAVPDAGRGEAPAHADDHALEHYEGLKLDPTEDESVDAKLAAIEMAGEEVAAGWRPAEHRPLAPEVRFLLLVASVLINGSAGLIESSTTFDPIVPMQAIRYWCLPVTFATLAVLGVFTSLVLIRTRIGLIYEVTKMNILLGLPSRRVERVNPLSIFYLMHLMTAMIGGASAGFAFGMLRLPGAGTATATVQGVVVGVAYVVLFQALYYATILRATTETKLSAAKG